MMKPLDISLHGTDRVAVIEQVAHCCRYTPGLVYLEGEEGKSPVNFLRDMVALLRDELDVVLLKDDCSTPGQVIGEILRQWHIYRDQEVGETDIQAIHHFLDVRAQNEQLALIVVERQMSLGDESIDFLVGLMARHSRLTVLLSGVFNIRKLLQVANQYEIPVNAVELPDALSERTEMIAQEDFFAGQPVEKKSENSFKDLDHTFSDSFADDLSDDSLDDNFSLESPSDFSLNASVRDSVGRRHMHEAVSGYKNPFAGYGLWLLVACGIVLLLMIVLRMPSEQPLFAGASDPAAVGTGTIVEPAPSQPDNLPPPVIGGQGQSGAVSAVVPQGALLQSDTPANAYPAEETALPVAEDVGARATHQPPPVKLATGSGAVIDAGSVAVPAPVPGAVKVPVVNQKRQPGSKSMTEKEWRARPVNYTVQVASAHSADNIHRLADALPSGHAHFVYRTVRDGKPWFVLLYGSFPERASAEAARDSLNAGIKSGTTPWVRKQGEVFGR